VAISIVASGTTSVATGATYTSLCHASGTTNGGVYQFWLDLKNMRSGSTPDQFDVKIDECVYWDASTWSSGEQTVFIASVSGSQSEPTWVSPSLILGVAGSTTADEGFTFYIRQSAGSNSTSFGYSVRKVA